MLRRSLVFLMALAVFAGGLAILGFLNSLPSAEEKRALARMRLDEESLSKSFDVLVIRAGFQRRSAAGRDIFVPCLLARALNSSSLSSKPATLRARFLRKGDVFCAAEGSIPALEPGAGCELWLKCIELLGFASVARGLTLAETTAPMDFEIVLESGGISVVVVKDQLRSLLL